MGNEVMCGVRTLGSWECLVKVTKYLAIKGFVDFLCIMSFSDKISDKKSLSLKVFLIAVRKY